MKFHGSQSLAGYAFSRPNVDASCDELPACITILRNTDTSEICIINLPFVAVDQGIYSQITQIVFNLMKINNVIVTVSHTHSSPSISESYEHLWNTDCNLRTSIINQIYLEIQDIHLKRDFKLLTSISVLRSKKIPAIYRRVRTLFGIKMLPNNKWEHSSYIYKVLFYSQDQVVTQFVVGDMHPTSNVDLGSISNDYFDFFLAPNTHFMPGVIGDIRPDITRISLKTLIATLGKYYRVFTRSHKYFFQFQNKLLNSLKFECISVKRFDNNSNFTIDKNIIYYSEIFKTSSKLKVGITKLKLPDLDFVFVTSEISSLIVTNSANRFFISCCAPYSGYLPDNSQVQYGGYEVNDNRKVLLKDEFPFSCDTNKWERFKLYLLGNHE